MEESSWNHNSIKTMITSAEEFIMLRQSERPEEYMRASCDEASVDVWLDLVVRFPEMRSWVAQNKTIPLDVLAILASDPDPDIRASVAMKNKLSGSLFATLASDTNESVRERIAYNKKTPIAVLHQLANDSSELVSLPARERIGSL